jgi:hypothetical protein
MEEERQPLTEEWSGEEQPGLELGEEWNRRRRRSIACMMALLVLVESAGIFLFIWVLGLYAALWSHPWGRAPAWDALACAGFYFVARALKFRKAFREADWDPNSIRPLRTAGRCSHTAQSDSHRRSGRR